MSRGHLDQEAYDAACRAQEWAAKHGKRAMWSRIYYNPDGSRAFYFTYEPLKPRRKGEVEAAPGPDPAAAPEPAKVRRGGVPKPEQGRFDL